ncbi:MAG: sulfurtransferase complex subunit TusC [Gammaproteobacteria bacterium]|nr:sulfurtransferase complex subunit TusC [Gammaproteobacteria bacterium]
MPCLVTLSHTPYGLTSAKESLDIALVLAAFEQQPALLFIDDGVLQLLPTVKSPASHKHIGKIMSALDMYDINHLWVEQESLQKLGLTPDQLSLPVKVLPRSDIAQLCAQYDQHMVF